MSERDELHDAEAADGVQPPAQRAAGRLPDPTPPSDAVAAPGASRTAPHRRRFRVLNAVLIVLALTAVSAAAVVFATGAGKDSAAQAGDSWSAFAPSTRDVAAGASEIAAYVGPKYRLPSGRQIVLVTGGPLELDGLPLRIAVRHSAAAGGGAEELSGGGALYRLCGLGPKCAITEGSNTKERDLLLHREALELALYSFHELKNTDNVVVFMPPGPLNDKGENQTIALAYRRGDVAGQLARPLRATLPAPVPTPQTIDQSPDTPFVKALTAGNIFSFSFTPANQDTSVFLVLDPPPADS